MIDILKLGEENGDRESYTKIADKFYFDETTISQNKSSSVLSGAKW